MPRINKFALKNSFLYMYSCCNLFYFAVIIFYSKSKLSEALNLLNSF